jgi:excinuclease ABC subunit A
MTGTEQGTRCGVIRVMGAREQNLRSIDIEIPHGSFTVITGRSGSGKSSLAFGTIYAEGQRQYLDSLSPYQRRRFERVPKPDVDIVDGLGPTIGIRQHVPGRNPRSSVGTITELGDFLRLLYSRAGSHRCLQCGAEVTPHTTQDLLRLAVAAIGGGEAILRLEPSSGHPRVLVRIAGDQDRVAAARAAISTLHPDNDAVLVVETAGAPPLYLSTGWVCLRCGAAAKATSSQFFNPNSPEGMCPACEGLGVSYVVSAARLIADANLSIRAGALTFYGDRRRQPNKTYWPVRDLPALLDHFGDTLDTPWRDLPEALRDILLYGKTGQPVSPATATILSDRVDSGLVPEIERLFRTAETADRKEFYQRFTISSPCRECGGTRLTREALSVRLGGLNIADAMALPLGLLDAWLDRVSALAFPSPVAEAVARLVQEMRGRLSHVVAIGLGYLCMDRSAPTLSAGEGQRLRIARQLTSTLVGIVYILDEPSVGLHPRDTQRLTDGLRRLSAAGNTVIVVEHDPDVIRFADHVIDIGPGAGRDGGRVVVSGPVQAIMEHPSSVTGRCLRGERFAAPRPRRCPPAGQEAGWLRVYGAHLHNLRGIDVPIPLGLLTCVTGPSGSGKTSLVTGTLVPAVTAAVSGTTPSGEFERLAGHDQLERVICAAQDPMGRSSRSIVATYIGIFDEVRRTFAKLPVAVGRGWQASRFSFNSEAGQCWACRGSGQLTMELHFLSDIVAVCPTCQGSRYADEVLDVRLNGLNIAEVLALEVEAARDFFSGSPRIRSALDMLCDVGLDYLRLGQSCTTLSGGEAQRLKLSREMIDNVAGGPGLYVLDEPTSGLHAADVGLLIGLLHRLVDDGNTVLLIEHNVDVIAAADWVIDLGPGSGPDGGEIVAQGPPEDIALDSQSPIGPFLRPVLTGLRQRHENPRIEG